MARSKPTQQLSAEEYTFVTEILNGSTVKQASEAVGISQRTGYEWKSKEHITAAIAAGREGHLKVMEEVRAGRVRATLPELAAKIDSHVMESIDVLVDLMHSGTKDDTVKLAAAKEIIRLSGLFMKQEVVTTTETTVKKGLSASEASEIRRKILGISSGKVQPPPIDVEVESIESFRESMK